MVDTKELNSTQIFLKFNYRLALVTPSVKFNNSLEIKIRNACWLKMK